jgi:D-erythronate 2-dehydrogenase
LVERLLARGSIAGSDGRQAEITELVLFDVAAPLPAPKPDKRLKIVTGDIADAAGILRLIDPRTGSVFHFAAVVSGQAEADTDIGYHVNLDGTRAVLEAMAARCASRPSWYLPGGPTALPPPGHHRSSASP